MRLRVLADDGLCWYFCPVSRRPGDGAEQVQCGRCWQALGPAARFLRRCAGCGARIEAKTDTDRPPHGEILGGASPPVPVLGLLLLPSDGGITGARPLPPIEWMPGAPIGDAAWSAQNRKINDLLAGRTT